MSIPRTRRELLEQLVPAWEKLDRELDNAGPDIGDLPCVDDWSVKDLLAVRVWWTGQTSEWIEAWRKGEDPNLPKQGYKWKETPRLNNDIVELCREESYQDVIKMLKVNFYRIRSLIDDLSDVELVDVGHFPQAGKFPVCRWISINTTRQYLTARTYVRRAIRKSKT